MKYADGLVSVIMPMYNAAATIEQTIESVRKQTYTNWELIVSDDCSTDESPDIVKKYCEMDSRIRYYRMNNNDGVAATRNLAMHQANGQYFAFLDSDDIWKAEKLEKQIDFMKAKDAHFVYSSYECMNQDGQLTGKVIHVPKELDYKKELLGNAIPCLTVIIDCKYVSIPDMPTMGHEDYVTWLNILKSGVKAYGMDEVLAVYRMATDSLSGNKVKAAKWTWSIYKQQGISFVKRIYYFGCYAVKALKKHV